MRLTNEAARSRSYRVQVGHAVVTVSGSSAEEAIRAARVQLSLELPRLYDVIQQLDVQRFQVAQID